MTFKEAKQKADEIHATLTAYDFKLDWIEILHEDGTHLKYHHAIYRDIGDWCAIYSEHNGYDVYSKGDLKWIKKWEEPELLYWNDDQ